MGVTYGGWVLTLTLTLTLIIRASYGGWVLTLTLTLTLVIRASYGGWVLTLAQPADWRWLMAPWNWFQSRVIQLWA